MDQGVARPAEIFGIHVFDKVKMKERLAENVYRQLMAAVNGESRLDDRIADDVAAAMKEWALSVGATHYAHWFQPRTEMTAERHMAFLNLDSEGAPIQTFGGSQLIRSEPDASSFPSGGMRDTFEARGYCTWDPSSPAFVVLSHKGGTLCIPSVFMAYDGTPLDMKTPLLKSIEVIRERALGLLKLFGNDSVQSVDVTIGAEQEYFLVDEEKARLRPDIELCRRTLIGAPSPKAQTVEAHYFGAIHPRVLAFMEDVERDMYRLGQVMSTRHNEVAPGQFEFAPVLAEANLGCDQNQMLMEVMRKMARRHHFQLLLHEKPFASVNGSGKHLNISLRDSEGRNLLKPANDSSRNVQFLSFVASFLMGVARHGGLLRASIASAGNSHRLGGNEAPPAVMSVFVGSLLDHVMSNIVRGMSDEITSKESLDPGLDRLPTFPRDTSDRNRTSPIAFTGNKWEFRAVGAPQALSGPLTILLALWAEGIERFSASLKSRIDTGSSVTDAALAAISDAWEESEAVRFEGNGYDAAWIEEAQRRGLPVCKNTVEALDQYLVREHRELLSGFGIMSGREIEAYHEVRLKQYCETIETELGVLRLMVYDGVLPAVTKQLAREVTTLAALPERSRGSLDVWEKSIDRLAKFKCDILEKVEELESVADVIHGKTTRETAEILVERGETAMAELRALCDAVEPLIAGEFWPYPRYTDLFKIEDFKGQ